MAFAVATMKNKLANRFTTLLCQLATLPFFKMQQPTLDDLELEYGTTILSELTGQSLTRNGQPVRLFDQTKHSAEAFYRSDENGKPYIQDFQNSKRYYPVTAYCRMYDVGLPDALADLRQQYYSHVQTLRTPFRPRRIEPPLLPRPVDYIPADRYEPYRTGFKRNGLYEYLRYTYSPQRADEVFAQYRLGTSRHWQYLGHLATSLPQFDIAGNLRQIKVMIFDAMNGRRVNNNQQAEKWNDKLQQYEPTIADSAKTCFIGKWLVKGANLQQCFFGEHLLTENPNQPVAIVEGETTAICCRIERPQFVWLATGGKNGAKWTNPEAFSVLQGRTVTMWPDADAHEQWQQDAEPLRPLVKSLQVSDYVKNNAPEGWNKADLRDLMRRPCWRRGYDGEVIYGEVL